MLDLTIILARAFRVLGPTLFALTCVGAAHAPGTLDMSGAATLMNTFKTFALYAGAVTAPMLRRRLRTRRSRTPMHGSGSLRERNSSRAL